MGTNATIIDFGGSKMKKLVKRPYGGLNPGSEYNLVSTCKDGCLISWRGQPLWVPNYIFEGNLDKRYEKREEEDDHGQQTDWR